MANQIRISDRMTDRRARFARTTLRFLLYGMLGVFFEIASFPIVRAGRMIPIVEYLFAFDCRPDPRLSMDGTWRTPVVTLFGHTSLWMVPIYILAAVSIEILYRNLLLKSSWMIRAFAYGLVILALEAATGLAVKHLTGYAIWMYFDRGNILQMTSLFILPIWMIVGFSVELLYRELMDPQIRVMLETKLSCSE